MDFKFSEGTGVKDGFKWEFEGCQLYRGVRETLSKQERPWGGNKGGGRAKSHVGKYNKLVMALSNMGLWDVGADFSVLNKVVGRVRS